MRSVYLDTNILIQLFEGAGELHDALWALIGKSSSANGPRFQTSALSFAEVLVKPYRENNTELVNLYQALSHSNDWLSVVYVAPSVIDRAAMIRASVGKIKLPDAIHLATASVLRSSHFMTQDMGISNLPSLANPFTGEALLPSIEIVRLDIASLHALSEALSQ